MYQGRPTWAEIDLSAILQNLQNIKAHIAPEVKLCAVVKADAYGHGAVQVARAALRFGVDYLAVATLAEAQELRLASISSPILILGYTPVYQYEELVSDNITQTIFTFEQGEALAAAALRSGRVAKAHLKIETGMGRLGVRADVAPALAEGLAALPGLELEGAFTHFAKADSRDKSHARHQFSLFMQALSGIKERGVEIPIKHCANSAATLDMPETHLDMVRPGIIIYGLKPSAECGEPFRLAPAICFKSSIAQLRVALPGESISYGGIYTCKGGEHIAVIPAGYADGWSRLLSGKANVLVNGVRVPQVGRICMDQCMLDVSAVAGVSEGDEVILFGGPQLPVDEVAACLKTINYEVVCMVSKRVPRVYFIDGKMLSQ